MFDFDLAHAYGIETSQLKRQVRRNIERFEGNDFMFEVTHEEILRCQNGTSSWGGSRYGAFAFTELGVSMRSSVLTSEIAIQTNVRIMRVFAATRRFLVSNAQVFQRLETLEYKQITTDQKVEKLYEKLEEGKLKPKQGIFYDGQIFDAYSFTCSLIKQAAREILLFDNSST